MIERRLRCCGSSGAAHRTERMNRVTKRCYDYNENYYATPFQRPAGHGRLDEGKRRSIARPRTRFTHLTHHTTLHVTIPHTMSRVRRRRAMIGAWCYLAAIQAACHQVGSHHGNETGARTLHAVDGAHATRGYATWKRPRSSPLFPSPFPVAACSSLFVSRISSTNS